MEDFVPVIDINELWDGANLNVIDFNNLPKPVTMNMWGPGLNASNNDIFILLQTCNPGLTTYNGSVSRRKASDKGVSLKVGITEDMKDLIRSKKNR